MIQKPGKPAEEVRSYRPISLLPVLYKVMEQLFLQRVMPIIEQRQLVPDHQYGFRKKHNTIDQVHRFVDKVNASLERKQYCSTVFLNVVYCISQGFDNVWHDGLLYKIKLNLPANYYSFLKSYLDRRFMYVKYDDAPTVLHEIYAGVPQGSVLGPVLYLLHTADLPTHHRTTVGTFADDMAVLAVHDDPVMTSNILQTSLYKIERWLRTWRIKVNKSKSIHITFANRQGICPPITLNRVQIPQDNHIKYLVYI